RGTFGFEPSLQGTLLDPSAERADPVARGVGPLGERRRSTQRVAAFVAPEEGLDKVDLQGQVELIGGHQGGRSRQEADRRVTVAPRVGSPSGGRETVPRRSSELVVAHQSELLPIATGLLEVVAHDLVQLDELTAVSLEPPPESLVQLRSRSLR